MVGSRITQFVRLLEGDRHIALTQRQLEHQMEQLRGIPGGVDEGFKWAGGDTAQPEGTPKAPEVCHAA